MLSVMKIKTETKKRKILTQLKLSELSRKRFQKKLQT